VNANDNSTSPSTPFVEIYTDGGCEPNPGPGGYGVVLLHPRKRAEASGGFRLTTNNRMEILAAIKEGHARAKLAFDIYMHRLQAGVGAIHLGNIATQFSLNDAANQQLGQIQSTGIWLGEKGGAGTIQHVDLVV